MDGIKKRDDSSTSTVVFDCRRANIRDKIEGEVMADDEVAALSFRIDALALYDRVDASDDEDDSDDDEKATVVLDTIAMMMTMTMAADLVLGRRLIAFAVFMVRWIGDRTYLLTFYVHKYSPQHNNPENLRAAEAWTMAVRRSSAVPIAVAWQEGALVSRHASPVCSSSIAMLNARGIIGRGIRKYANIVLPNYAMRRCSRTHRPRKTVPSAFYRCHIN
jgi:hypothetical protein